MNDTDLLMRMTGSIHGFSRAFGSAARDGRVLELRGVTACVAPAIPFRSIFNSAAYDSVEELRAALPELAAAYEEAGVTAWAVWAHDSDAAAASLLEGAGHVLDSRPAAMVMELDSVEPPDGGFHLERADDLGAVDGVLAAAYEFPPGVMVYVFPRLLETFNVYLARGEAGEALCTLATVEVDGDCGVTLVGTAPAGRRRGVATALMRRALLDARERGCTSSTLQSTEMAETLYERLGYRRLGVMQLWELRQPSGRR